MDNPYNSTQYYQLEGWYHGHVVDINYVIDSDDEELGFNGTIDDADINTDAWYAALDACNVRFDNEDIYEKFVVKMLEKLCKPSASAQ